MGFRLPGILNTKTASKTSDIPKGFFCSLCWGEQEEAIRDSNVFFEPAFIPGFAESS